MANVVVTTKLNQEALALFDQAGIRYTANQTDTPWSPTVLKTQLREAKVLVCSLIDIIDVETITAAPNLEIIANIAVGYDNVDVAAATERGILVTNTPDVLTETTADLAFGLLLAIARRIPEADRYMRAGKYQTFKLFPDLLGIDVYGKTLGIVGMGRIGTAVARRGALGFGMSVLYTANSPKKEAEIELGARQVSFKELLKASDFISINTPLNDETRHLFTLHEFRRMKPTACLINTARGPVINEADLVIALKQNMIHGAALDVFEEEPQMHPGLAQFHDRLVVTPHVGSATIETRNNMAALAVQNVIAYMTDQPVLTPVN